MLRNKHDTKVFDKKMEAAKKHVKFCLELYQSIWTFHGKGAMAAKAQLYTDKVHGIDDHLGYFGPQLEETGRCQVEVTIRIREAQQAWDHYNGFWAKTTNLDLKRMIFRNMILSTLMSGMISLNTTQLDINRLHAKMMALARGSLAGKATIKDENVEHIITKLESEIMKLMKIGSFEIELDIARLSYWQRIFREPNHHQQVITSVFCQFPFDEDIESYMENSRYKAFKTILNKMNDYDSLLDLYYDLGDFEQLLIDEKMRERFVHIDFKVMRVALWTNCIPPFVDKVAASVVADDTEVIDDRDVGSHQCILKLKNDEICERYFKSDQSFNRHKRKSLQHEQAPMPSGCAFVCSNQCPWCRRIFKNKKVTESHVTRSFKAKQCLHAKIKDKKLQMRGNQIKCDGIFFAISVKLILTI